jgi:hypothetical protein
MLGHYWKEAAVHERPQNIQSLAATAMSSTDVEGRLPTSKDHGVYTARPGSHYARRPDSADKNQHSTNKAADLIIRHVRPRRLSD